MALGELVDGFGRRLNYVRISVTDRCNFRCTYCMPEEGVKCLSHRDILRYEDIAFLCGAFAELGVGKFRFTGGEPLVRKGLVPFLQNLHAEIPHIKTALTTNASLLEEYAEGLARAGLHSLNISLDTLDQEKFRKITRIGDIERVYAGIKAAKRAGLANIKLNTVLIRGFNDGEVERLLEFAEEHGLLLRLIEFMPLEDDVWTKEAFISGQEILSMLPGGRWIKEERGGTNSDGPAQYFVNEATGRRIGVIGRRLEPFLQKLQPPARLGGGRPADMPFQRERNAAEGYNRTQGRGCAARNAALCGARQAALAGAT